MSTLRNEQYAGMEETVRQYVVKRFGEKPELEKIWDTPITPTISRSIKDLVQYLYKEARKLLQEGNECVAVDDATVFGWINHYLEEEGSHEVTGLKNAEETPKQAECEPETEAVEEEPKEEMPKPLEAKPEPKKRGRKPKPEPEGIGKQLMLFSL